MRCETLMALVACAIVASVTAVSVAPTATSATPNVRVPDVQATPPSEARLGSLTVERIDGELFTLQTTPESIRIGDGLGVPMDEAPVSPRACYNDAVDCANRMKDRCATRGGVKWQKFESTIEKCSAECNNGDSISCTKDASQT